MSFLVKIRDWLGLGASVSDKRTELSEMQEAMEVAQLAKRGEDYERALAALDRAMRLADEQKDTYSVAVIALHQADILILQGEYEDAESLLQTVQQTANAANQMGFLSYGLSSLGRLYQERGAWDQARGYYEQARDTAQQAESAAAEARAMGYLADVYMHEQNASYAVHLLQECLPMLNAGGDLDMSSYFVGRLGEAMMATGQQEEGLRLLDRALRLGEQLRDKRMVRRWSLALARAFDGQSRYNRAYELYKRALPMFEATPAPEYINALTRTSHVCLSLGQPEEALVYAEQAVQVAEESDDDALRAQAAGAYGEALRSNGQYEQALLHLQTAFELSTARTPSARVSLLRQLGAAQAASETAHDAAEATYEQGIALAEANDLQFPLAALRRDLGLYYARQRQPGKALVQWDAARSIFEAADEHEQVARLYCDIASARRQLGQGERSIRDFEQALIRLNNVDDLATRGLVLSNAANAYADQGDTESAAAFFRESIEIAEQVGDEVAETTRRGNYGWFLLSTGQPRQGMEELEAALIDSERLGLGLQAAVQTDNIGLAYDALSQYKLALSYHEDALERLQKLDPAPKRWQAMVRVNAAKTLLSLGRTDEAASFLEQALTQAREAGDFEVLVAALVGRARLLLVQDDAQAAESLLTEAVQIARKADMRRRLAEALTAQSEQQAALGNDEQARALWDEAQGLFRMVGSPKAKQTAFWLGNNPPDDVT